MSLFKDPMGQLFGSGYNPSRNIAKNYLQQMGNMSGAFQNRIDRSGAAVNRFDPMYQAAIRSRVNYLQQQPFSAEEDALALGRASGNIANQYGMAQSNLARMLANRGIGGGVEAGALANLEGARMGQRAATQYQTALARIAARNAAQQEALGLLGGARSMYSGEEMAGLSGLQNLYGNLYQGYANIGSAEQAQKQAGQQMIGQLIQAAAASQGVPIPNPASRSTPTPQAQYAPVQYAPPGSSSVSDFYGNTMTFDEYGNEVYDGGYQTQRAQPRRKNFFQKMFGI